MQVCHICRIFPTIKPETLSKPAQQSDDDTVFRKLKDNMRKDQCFSIIENDPVIQQVGKAIIGARKQNKLREARNKAQTTMRRLARLKQVTGVQHANELFSLRNMADLELGLDKLCQAVEPGKPQKAGLKIGLATLIRFSSKIYKVTINVKLRFLAMLYRIV